MENNIIHDAVTDSNDSAAICAGDSDWTTRGNVIRYNYFYDITVRRVGFHTNHGIYLDDGNSSTSIYGNVFRRVEQPIQIGGGHDNSADHNIFVDCVGGLRIDDRCLTAPQEWMDAFFVHAQDVPWATAAWRSKYPGVYATLTSNDYRYPTGNSMVGNVALRSTLSDRLRVWGIWELWGVNANAPDNILKFQDNVATETQQFVDEPNGDFTPLNGSAAKQSGIVPVKTSELGVQRDTFIDPRKWQGP